MIKKLTITTRRLRLPRGAMAAAIAGLAWLVAILLTWLLAAPAQFSNDFFYDLFYRTRPQQGMQDADVVLVAADQESFTAVRKRFNDGWPWPREFWGDIATYLDKAGARAIVFDILFVEPSSRAQLGDDDLFSESLKAIKTPVIFGSEVVTPADSSSGAAAMTHPAGPATTRAAGATAPVAASSAATWEAFAPEVKNPIFGAVSIGDEKIFRRYPPTVLGLPAIATSTLAALKVSPRIPVSGPFLLHYYGPFQSAAGRQTFRYVRAAAVLGAQLDAAKGLNYGITPELFRGKIVILCATAAGAYDLKSSPLSAVYPGAEVHATAIENMLRGDLVEPVPSAGVALIALLCAAAIAAGVILPRSAALKLFFPVAATLLLFLVAIGLFRGATIRWLPPVEPLLAIVLAAPLAFAWTYFAEDRQRRFMLKALSKVVSPAVAEQLARDPARLARATSRTELTLLFTDLANFTELSEGLDVQQLGQFMNRYLGEMSDQVLSQDGTLDKYIGDAVMCFWNAPLPQADHAARACRAALRMVAREEQLQKEFSAALGNRSIYTRIGINTAHAAVGFIGSDHLFNYTALGDGVNLASRLEGANKLYGTRILLSAHTAALVAKVFWLRKIDLLRVKGKKEPMAVYQLLAERGTDDQRHGGLIARHEEAFAAYQRRDWNAAEQLLLELSAAFGQDGPAEALLARVREYRRHPPPAGDAWDGVYVATSK